MRTRLSLALAATVAVLWSGSQVFAGSNDSFGAGAIEVPSLLNAAPLSSDGSNFVAQQSSVERFLLAARVSSAADLNPVDNLDPIDVDNSQSGDAYSALYRSVELDDSPYSLLTDGGTYLGSTFSLTDTLHAHVGAFAITPDRPDFGTPSYTYLNQVIGQQALYEMGKSQSGVAIVDWSFASWGALGLMATETSEQAGVLNGISASAIDTTKSTKTSTVGMTAHVGFGDGWVTTLSYNEGLTQLALRPDVSGNALDGIHSRAYGFSVAKHGLFDENDSLGLALTRPLQVYSGGDQFATDGFDTSLANLQPARQFSSLSSTTQETDFELGYVTTFMGGAVALQTNAGYQMNVDGFGGTNALSVISRAKINF
jgi:hypothetical protein